ncbi:receptor-type tyrosine-protein phosphatase R-like isoform X6 [Stegostoma tigrinum]|uniref:receptor-type tyrosine-protein phosphatase R-like isoform X6 n=1 Tax=Stegostoma tigrinum TaxID=3053191 RepID=UPI0028703DA7|nr:receptor-type tyrosine-protein phosphatase R-like isoform X6 [Stegostoma tigrinum]
MQGWLGIRLLCVLLQLHIAGCFSGDRELFKTRSQRKSASNGKPVMIYQNVQNIDKGVDLSSTEMPRSTIKMSSFKKYTDQSRPHPAMIVKSVLPRVSNERSIHFVVNNDQQLEIEKLPIPEDDLISVFLYRLKEKLHFQVNQDKQQHQSINLSSVPVQQSQPEVKVANSMVQPGSVSGTVSVNIDPQGRPVPEIKPCVSSGPSPFKMKPACLQERRGSNVSLTLDMSTLGNVESLKIAPTPRDKIFLEYLQTASRVLTRLQLRECVASTQSLQAEFMEIPMNFVNPKELNIPCHGAKNRYKTILPNPHSRVCLIPKSDDEPVSNTYINANYIRGYRGQQRAYIATQGPMINTVNDFWRMVWQEDCPVIVMITKLKEKNEKCVLYWPEKRGIYGKVEVLVNSVTEYEHYVIRDLTLKHEGKSQNIKHYWYKSWPDHKTPDSAQPLLQLMLKVEETRQKSPGRGPVVVHCSAGIGRTGCFIAITIGCHQLKNEGVVDILSIVCQLRVDRYIVLYKVHQGSRPEMNEVLQLQRRCKQRSALTFQRPIQKSEYSRKMLFLNLFILEFKTLHLLPN